MKRSFIILIVALLSSSSFAAKSSKRSKLRALGRINHVRNINFVKGSYDERAIKRVFKERRNNASIYDAESAIKYNNGFNKTSAKDFQESY